MPPNASAVEGFEAITRRSDGAGALYFLFSGEKRKVPKKKAVMPPNTSAVEGFEAITRRSDGERALYFLFSGEKRKVPKKKAPSVKLRLPGVDLEKRLGHRVPALIEPAPSWGA